MQPEQQLSEADFAVGYGKPPPQHRFPKGRSGNPRGRPKGAKNLATLIAEHLGRKVTITEGGRRRQVSKREVIAMQLVNGAASKDPKATAIVLSADRLAEATLPAAGEPDGLGGPGGDALDQEILRDLKRRLRRGTPEGGDA